jgi:hemoglobin-like flavoprotein
MITDTEKTALKHSWRLVVPIAETAADLFYKRLFELKPDYRLLFPDDMSGQKRKLLRMLAFIVKALDWADDDWRADVAVEEDLMLVVLAMGRRHTQLYKVPDESYAVVGEALIWTLDMGLGDAFTEDVKRAWIELYTLVAKTMRMGAAVAVRDDRWADTSGVAAHGEAALTEQLRAAGIDDAQFGKAGQSSSVEDGK